MLLLNIDPWHHFYLHSHILCGNRHWIQPMLIIWGCLYLIKKFGLESKWKQFLPYFLNLNYDLKHRWNWLNEAVSSTVSTVYCVEWRIWIIKFLFHQNEFIVFSFKMFWNANHLYLIDTMPLLRFQIEFASLTSYFSGTCLYKFIYQSIHSI